MKSSSCFVICIKPEWRFFFWLLCFVVWIKVKVSLVCSEPFIIILCVCLACVVEMGSSTAQRKLLSQSNHTQRARPAQWGRPCLKYKKYDTYLCAVVEFYYLLVQHSQRATRQQTGTDRWIKYKSLPRCSNTQQVARKLQPQHIGRWFFYLCCQTSNNQKPSRCPSLSFSVSCPFKNSWLHKSGCSCWQQLPWQQMTEAYLLPL